MKNVFSWVFEAIFGSKKAWWVEVTTQEPACTYYFGPFETSEEAQAAQQGYVDDLEQEGAKQVQVTVVNRSRPENLTVYGGDQAGSTAPKTEPALSGQP